MLNDGGGHAQFRRNDCSIQAVEVRNLTRNTHDVLRSGIGAAAVALSDARAKELSAEYLRLFVVDYNESALRFYRKLGFSTAEGEYHQHMTDGRILREFGMEVKVQ